MEDDRNPKEEVPDNVPYVVVDTDGNRPPQRPRILWPALAGGGLLVIVAGFAVLLYRRPSGIPPAPFPVTTEIAFARPVPPELPPVPATLEPVVEDPVVEEPAEDPGPPPPPNTVVAAVPRAEELAPKVEEPPAPSGPRPEAERIPSPVIAAPAPAPPAEPSSVEIQLQAAAADIREAERFFREVAERFDSGAIKDANLRELAHRMDRIEQNLKEARGVYGRLRPQVSDPETLERRVRVLDELLESLKEGRARIKVPLAILEAETLEGEAALFGKEALDGFQPFSREAQALDAKAEAAIAKLREARERYRSIRKDVPDPTVVDRRVRSLDALVDKLEERYPSVKSAR
jgi:hypothetical protein